MLGNRMHPDLAIGCMCETGRKIYLPDSNPYCKSCKHEYSPGLFLYEEIKKT